MNLEQICDFADDNLIKIKFLPIPIKKAVAMPNHIYIDTHQVEDFKELKQILAEEIGHCVNNAFYTVDDCFTPLGKLNINKAEAKARDFSVGLTVPLNELKKAIKNGYDDYDIAEALGVNIATLKQAVDYYYRKQLL